MPRAVIGFILGLFFAENFLGPPPSRFYLKEVDHGLECAMERHFPFDRTVYCSEQAQQVLSLVQLLNHPPSSPLPIAHEEQ